MKTLRFLSFAALAVLLSSCAEMTSVDNTDEKTNTIAAVMEGIQTKTSTTDEGRFSWSEGDNIWLETTAGDVIGTLATGDGTQNATFNFGAFMGELTGRSVYPYNTGHSVEDDVLNVVLPASYNLGSNLENTNAPMYGVNVNGTLKFNHLAGVMRFAFKNVPAGVDKFTITVDKKINGLFEADLTADYPVLQTESTNVVEERTVTINFDAIANTSDIKLFVPLPLGTYESLELALYKGEEAIWTYSKDVTNTINRKSLKLMPSVSMGGTIGGEIEGGDVPVAKPGDYVDEYGINHGQGVQMSDGTTWAPVDCGYHAELHPHGKFYQFGRKYGVGYPNGSYPEYVEGPVSLSEGQSPDNADKIYTGEGYSPDWLDSGSSGLWLDEQERYNPCPTGWRIAHPNEWIYLKNNAYSEESTDAHGHVGYSYMNENAYNHLGENTPKLFISNESCPNEYNAAYAYANYWTAWHGEAYRGVGFHLSNGIDNAVRLTTALRIRCVLK